MMQPDATLDLRGEVCPIPAMYAKARLGLMEPGEVLDVFVDHLCAVDGVPAAMAQAGHKVIGMEAVDTGVFRIRIEAGGSSRSGR